MAVVSVFFAVVIVFFLFFRGRRVFSQGLKLYQERASTSQKQSESLLQGEVR